MNKDKYKIAWKVKNKVAIITQDANEMVEFATEFNYQVLKESKSNYKIIAIIKDN